MNQSANAWTMIAIVANNALPKLYAVSALWTLNSRKRIRLARSTGQNTSSVEATSGGRRRTNNVELGPLSGNRGTTVPIQVRTHVQTIQYGDDSMFSPKTPMDELSERDERDSTIVKDVKD